MLAQEQLGLTVDKDAVLCVFMGRWVYQKGIDVLADCAGEMLLLMPKLQLVVIGPTGDVYGQYAAVKFEFLCKQKIFEGRIVVENRYFQPPESLRWGASFCIMPSRLEPFGYVDIELAWHGTPTIGPAVGGLGKVPGVYFNVWDAALAFRRPKNENKNFIRNFWGHFS